MIEKIAKSADFPHLLFYGPHGSGKRTITKCLLHELYQTSAVHKIKSDFREFKISPTSSTTTEIVVFSSNYHIEVTPSEAEMYDRVIVQQLIKEIATSQPLINEKATFKLIVIHEMDNMT